MNQNEVESQLSAMFDGELPAAECELLSRRIDRDENLRARWSRYALIGAAMRSEPVATARSGFSQRVSAALAADSTAGRAGRGRNRIWSAALAATLVASVAGLSVSMLRDAALRGGGSPGLQARAQTAVAMPAASALEPQPALIPALNVESHGVDSHGPLSYVTPTGNATAATILRTQLADYIVAHSAYSTPLLRRNVLSELMTSEDTVGIASSYAGAVGTTQGTAAGGGDASRSNSAASR